MKRLTSNLRGALPYAGPGTVLILVWIAVIASTPSLRGEAGAYVVGLNFELVGLVAVGVAITMIAGELDLSVGSMAAVGGVVAVRVSDAGIVVAILAATLAGLLVGTLQGYLISRLKLNSFVFTIATLIVLRGVAYVFASDGPLPLSNFDAADILLERWWGVLTVGAIVALAAYVALGIFMSTSRIGRDIRAIGGARTEAAAAGVRVDRAVITAFAISATCAGLAGGLASIKAGSAVPWSYPDLLLSGVAAALIGGIALEGGRGTVWNVAIGVAILGLLGAALTAHGAQDSLSQLFTGVLLLLIVTVELGSKQLQARRLLAARSSELRGRPGT